MDLTWITAQIAVGGGIWTDAKMIELVHDGVTHIINMQIEFDDRPLAKPYGVKVLWTAVDDDFEPKPARIFDAGVKFALEALSDQDARLYVHCAAGVHRAPMMTLAILRKMGWTLEDATEMVQEKRPVVDWAEVYVKSVEDWMAGEESKV
jgi:protein-tyrosine phosphatase